jgi:hypothetical protein
MLPSVAQALHCKPDRFTKKVGNVFNVKSLAGKVVGSESRRMKNAMVAGGKSTLNLGKATAQHVSADFVARSSEQGVERLGQRLSKQSLIRMERNLGKPVVTQGAKIASRRSSRLINRDAALQFGRACLVAVPVLGGLFTLTLFRNDINRAREEWSLRAKPPSCFFAVAGLADFLDALLHFWIAIILITKAALSKMHFAENLSSKCMVVSTSCLIIAEILSFRCRSKDKLAA